MKIGIIGLGNFGSFVAGLLAKDKKLEILACDAGNVDAREGVKRTTLKGVAEAEIIILCVPLASYQEVLPELKPLLKQDTLVVDICSVKVESASRLKQLLPRHRNLLVTHPMFGPQSAANGTAGHVLVVTDSVGNKAEAATNYCQSKLGLKILRMTNEEHDKAMADVHALTFFVARGLARTGLAESPFQAPSFQMLLDLVAFDRSHSDDLFNTIELGNPFAKQARDKLMANFTQIESELEIAKNKEKK